MKEKTELLWVGSRERVCGRRLGRDVSRRASDPGISLVSTLLWIVRILWNASPMKVGILLVHCWVLST